jgi:hypothetical protein
MREKSRGSLVGTVPALVGTGTERAIWSILR